MNILPITYTLFTKDNLQDTYNKVNLELNKIGVKA